MPSSTRGCSRLGVLVSARRQADISLLSCPTVRKQLFWLWALLDSTAGSISLLLCFSFSEANNCPCGWLVALGADRGWALS